MDAATAAANDDDEYDGIDEGLYNTFYCLCMIKSTLR
jgi:hypothetical protein